jgi:hypothetical protein
VYELHDDEDDGLGIVSVELCDRAILERFTMSPLVATMTRIPLQLWTTFQIVGRICSRDNRFGSFG